MRPTPAAWVASSLVLALASGCARPAPVRRAFYFWRTVFALSSQEQAVLRSARVERLYVRFFDVAASAAPERSIPVGRITFRDAPPAGVEIVPVVFLKNEVLEAEARPVELAGRVWALVGSLAREAGVGFGEIQVDCDWSESTREPFFALARELGRLGAEAGVSLSATIRLHQIKFRERTGVPPVDRGMLMFYNMGRLDAGTRKSSIFNVADAARYAPALGSYPLPLDVALPIFSWLVHARGGEVVGLVGKVAAAELDASPYLQPATPGRWVAREPAFLRGTYVRPGDTLIQEEVTPEDLRQAAAMLAGRLGRSRERSVALFDLDERNLARLAPADLEAAFAWSE